MLLTMLVLTVALVSPTTAMSQTVGGGTVTDAAVGPPPSYGIGGDGMVLVKNWDFGANGTIRDIADLNAHFQYHNQYGLIDNGGGKYGALIVAPDAANAIPGQPIEDPNKPVRRFFDDSLRTYLVPLNGATTVDPSLHNAGNGSFQAKFTLPNGGSLLGQDIVWETRVRYVTPPYFWFSIWTSGNLWHKGAELDLVESFGYDNGGGHTNFDGRYWHSAVAGGTQNVKYSNWNTGMASVGIKSFDATEYHTWTLLYRKDDTYSIYMDGIEVQHGKVHWTRSGIDGGTPINMSFIFDAGWGHTGVSSVNRSLPASAFDGKYYEWDYSRIYLSPPVPEPSALGPLLLSPLAMRSSRPASEVPTDRAISK